MRRYEVIIKIAEYENITLAAKSLGYTQASLSQMISRTEDELQVKLFHRLRHGVKLTYAGKDIIQYMKRIEELERAMSTAALSHRKSMLRVGSFYSATAYWLPGILKRFAEKHPDTVVTVIEKENWSGIEKCITLGEADCAFYAGVYHTGHEFFPLYRDPYFALVSEDHPLAGQEEISIAALDQYPFIMPSEGSESDVIHELVQGMRVKPNILMKTQGDEGTIAMVESGFGVTVLPGLIARNTRRRVRAIALTEPITREIGIISKPQAEASEVCRAFICVANEYAQQFQG